jgi:tryptophan 2-monooxygenase
MPFITRLPRPGAPSADSIDPADYPATYVDILYDHAAYLRRHGKLGEGRLENQRIAIVGAGAAGLLAAYQLMQLGAKPVMLEATERAGGRLHTVHPIPGQAAAFEMGAMRVPPCEQLFGYYAERFGLRPGGQFPDPGQVTTRIIYRNKGYEWKAGDPPPAMFARVHQAWSALASEFEAVGKLLVRPTPESLAEAQRKWQSMVYRSGGLGPEQGYSTISFYQGLVEAFVENYRKYGLDAPWTAEEFELFAALGVGSGGFGSLYPVNFSEIARLIINGLETDQQFYPGGMGELVDGFLRAEFDGERLADRIHYRHCARAIRRESGGWRIEFDSGAAASFDAVIVATTTRSMQVDMNLSDCAEPLLPEPVRSGVRGLHLMNSSKLFVLTRSKFWQKHGSRLPANIQSDTLVRGLYCLDYNPDTPTEGPGVVLISYTWGDDSTKYLGLKNANERLEACLRSLEHQAGDFVTELRREIMPEHTRMIDWQLEPGYYGAFKLNQPGQDVYNQRLYEHFLSTSGLYLCGDSVGWCGGWIESALQSGMNAAAAVVQQFCGDNALYPNSPMSQPSGRFRYGPPL